MKSLKPLIVLLIALCLGQTAHAASSLGFGATTYSQDTLNLGDTLRINTYLKNYDTATYASTLGFRLKINGILNVNQNIFPNPLQGQQLNLAPGDSLALNMIVVITPAYFVVGPDILVVWPYPTDGGIAHDSLIKQIIVRDYGTSITEPNLDGAINAWLQYDQFIINTDAALIELNRVSFYNLYGEMVDDVPANNNTQIPIGHLPRGIYIAEITYNGNQRKLVKISK
ncbi:MAG: T9SS type A sorting domain-containing protein [Bacteroidetes bacterium]|nr:T9SS type A sorting domain-containing protein [Bacteroidota bacterium]